MDLRFHYIIFHNLLIVISIIFRLYIDARLKRTKNTYFRIDIVIFIFTVILSYGYMFINFLVLKDISDLSIPTMTIDTFFSVLSFLLLLWVSVDYLEFKDKFFIHQNSIFIRKAYYYDKIKDCYHYFSGRHLFIRIYFINNKKKNIRCNEEIINVFKQKNITIRKSKYHNII